MVLRPAGDLTRSASCQGPPGARQFRQPLDVKFNPATFKQDLHVWETIKARYERQSVQPLPNGVLVATLLNKTTGVLEQHLILNPRTLQTYAQILEYHRSRFLMNPAAQTNFSGWSLGYDGHWCPRGRKKKENKERKERKERKRTELFKVTRKRE